MGMIGISNGLINGTHQQPVLAVGADTTLYKRSPRFI